MGRQAWGAWGGRLAVRGVGRTMMGVSPASMEQQSRPSMPQMTEVGQSGPPQRMEDFATVTPGCERM